jgi:hypothetical protein
MLAGAHGFGRRPHTVSCLAYLSHVSSDTAACRCVYLYTIHTYARTRIFTYIYLGCLESNAHIANVSGPYVVLSLGQIAEWRWLRLGSTEGGKKKWTTSLKGSLDFNKSKNNYHCRFELWTDGDKKVAKSFFLPKQLHHVNHEILCIEFFTHGKVCWVMR